MYQELKGFPPYNLNSPGSHGKSGLNPQHAREVGASEEGVSMCRFELIEFNCVLEKASTGALGHDLMACRDTPTSKLIRGWDREGT